VRPTARKAFCCILDTPELVFGTLRGYPQRVKEALPTPSFSVEIETAQHTSEVDGQKDAISGHALA
jgi:hypothetical protein